MAKRTGAEIESMRRATQRRLKAMLAHGATETECLDVLVRDMLAVAGGLKPGLSEAEIAETHGMMRQMAKVLLAQLR